LIQRVIGAFLNAIGILIGAVFGLALLEPLNLRTQIFFRSALGVFTVCVGIVLVWLSINGSAMSCVRQFCLAVLAIVLGRWLGKQFRLQDLSNRLGRFTGQRITAAQNGSATRLSDGFNSCVLLFCVGPLGLLGAVTDGLSGFFYLLAIKGLMDGLAMTGLVKTFNWFSALSAFPVFAFLCTITFTCHVYAAPLLSAHGLTDSVNATIGLITITVALVIFEVHKVDLANYLPSLILAPVLTWLTA
jgi:uncharacterized membrane protein YqgA involved in biofilm formation